MLFPFATTEEEKREVSEPQDATRVTVVVHDGALRRASPTGKS